MRDTLGGRPQNVPGAGGLVTTVDDQLAFGRMLLAHGDRPSGRLLSEGSIQQMMIDQITPEHRQIGGFFLDGRGWGFGGTVDTEVLNPWNVPGRYG